MSISVKNLSKTIRGVEVLRNVSIEVPDGTVVGLQGVNGSGKTMLMRAVCGLIRPTSGHVVVGGKELFVDCDFPDDLGLLIEGPAFLDGLTAEENLELIACIKGVVGSEDIKAALGAVELDAGVKKYKAFSLGMRQRLGIAAAIMEHPRVLVLDEPTNALDSAGVQMVKRVVRSAAESGAAVLLSCHDGETLRELSDVIYRIVEGKIEGCE